ncbi:hypothetical protein PSDVSF_21400 [Pseudodesulfovibrio sediminis]|uniref:Uncharacterized protein n=1 Tax=Pseudodesulfovibrio sediminis TaxID=2810563 RepID=A0ABM7P7E0_9BACT|nr:hypothetical protein PSDVSF_21400 [Pseudodesulfovibrio sediminis]
MRQIILILSDREKRIPSSSELRSLGFLVSTAVADPGRNPSRRTERKATESPPEQSERKQTKGLGPETPPVQKHRGLLCDQDRAC